MRAFLAIGNPVLSVRRLVSATSGQPTYAGRTRCPDLVITEQFGQSRTGAVDAALDCANLGAADRSRLLIAEPLGCYQEKGLALIDRQLRQSGPHVLEVKVSVLR